MRGRSTILLGLAVVCGLGAMYGTTQLLPRTKDDAGQEVLGEAAVSADAPAQLSIGRHLVSSPRLGPLFMRRAGPNPARLVPSPDRNS